MSILSRRIILFEANEIPFRVLDDFCKRHPESALGRRQAEWHPYETTTEAKLDPWITWPTLHRGVLDHGVLELGQDTASIDAKYPPLWKLLAEHGIRTGVFGSLHSYPPPADAERYAFYVPDVFADGPEIHPRALSTFQEFNLAMSRESSRNVSAGIHWKSAMRLLARIPQLGLRLTTLADLAGQLAAERRNRWRRVRRRTYQTVLGFDVFMRQLRRTEPEFCTFFTNHVASAMHRYWAASFPDDYDQFGYDDDWVGRFGGEIDFAMQKLDDEFDRLVAFAEAHPEYVILVASSMGQAATHAMAAKTQLHLRDIGAFMSRLGIASEDWSLRAAMDPDVSLSVKPERVASLRATLDKLVLFGAPVPYTIDDGGFLHLCFGRQDVAPEDCYLELDGERIPFAEVGLVNEEIEDQTGGSAYHVPEGMLLIWDPVHKASSSERPRISTVDIAPYILRNFGVPAPEYMSSAATIAPLA